MIQLLSSVGRFSLYRCTPATSVRTQSFATAVKASSDPARREYWQGVFRSGADSFSLPEVNPNLEAYFSKWRESWRRPSSVFVPLCGCSEDITWLAGQPQTTVVGLDFAPDALQRWGEDNGGIDPLATSPDMTVFRSRAYPNVTLFHADIFSFPAARLASTMDLVWDRGALTSLASEDRVAYLRLLRACLKPHSHATLLLEFLYCNLPMDGSMDADACRSALRDGGFEQPATTVRDEDVRAEYPAFCPPGLQCLREVVLAVRRGV